MENLSIIFRMLIKIFKCLQTGDRKQKFKIKIKLKCISFLLFTNKFYIKTHLFVAFLRTSFHFKLIVIHFDNSHDETNRLYITYTRLYCLCVQKHLISINYKIMTVNLILNQTI